MLFQAEKIIVVSQLYCLHVCKWHIHCTLKHTHLLQLFDNIPAGNFICSCLHIVKTVKNIINKWRSKKMQEQDHRALVRLQSSHQHESRSYLLVRPCLGQALDNHLYHKTTSCWWQLNQSGGEETHRVALLHPQLAHQQSWCVYTCWSQGHLWNG